MTQTELERDLIALLRQRALSGSDREIALDEPIGEMGIGLDSLAMVEFMVQIEKHYQVEIPQTIWFTKEGLSLADIAAIIRELARDGHEPVTPILIVDQSTIDDATGSREKLLRQARSAHRSLLTKAWSRSLRPLYEKSSCVILCFDLTREFLPLYKANVELRFRSGNFEDFENYYRKNPILGHEKTLKIYSERFARGYLCLIAESDGVIIGRDWLSPVGDYEQGLNLTVKMQPGSIYGLDLTEHRDFRGKGIGLALLSYALSETKRLGFKKQYTMVRTSNERMLIGAIQLFGFKNVGSIQTTRFFKRTRSKWKLSDQGGVGEITL